MTTYLTQAFLARAQPRASRYGEAVSDPTDDPEHPRGGKRAYLVAIIILVAISAMVLGAMLIDPR